MQKYSTKISQSEVENEEWREVPSYPELEASSLGRVRIKPYEQPMPNGGVKAVTPKPLWGTVHKASKTATCRHMLFRWNKRRKNLKVHRLVCEAFHGPCPKEYTDVIHLDENGLNNRPENLKWGTRKENLNMPKIKEWHYLSKQEKMMRRAELLG